MPHPADAARALLVAIQEARGYREDLVRDIEQLDVDIALMEDMLKRRVPPPPMPVARDIDVPHSRPPDSGVPVSAEVANWRAMPRTQAVIRVLEEAGSKMHRQAIRARLAEIGRLADGIGDVSAALAYLGRGDRAKVRAVGGGFWELTDHREGGDTNAPTDDGAEEGGDPPTHDKD